MARHDFGQRADESVRTEVQIARDSFGDDALDLWPVVHDLRVGEPQNGVPAQTKLRVMADVRVRSALEEWNAKPSS